MKLKFLVLILLFITMAWQAKSQISGVVVDSTQTPLTGASVLLLQAADSVMAKFDITDDKGQFEMAKPNPDDYILQVTFIGYETYTQPITLDASNHPIIQNPIILNAISQDLQEVLVEAERAPIVIKNDTIQYNADAFQTKPNAVVEDLLKKFPGVEVDRSGKIKAQGKEVDKVLVDGKEFFGDDPTIATQNLPADIVDKVQVFDRKSEASEFTGVDDGERNTTINLGLKEDKKTGYFGTVEAGYGTKGRFQGKGNINRFTTRTQLSVIGRLNNINEQGFTIQDYFDFMGGMGALASGNLINPEDLGISFDGNSRSNGFVTTGVGGLNLNHDFSAKTDLSASYFYNRIDRDLDRQSERQNFSGMDDLFNSEETDQREATNTNHRLNTRLKYKIDTLQDLQIRVNFGFNDADVIAATLRNTLNAETALETAIDRHYRANDQRFDANANAIYRRKLGKPGRSIVADIGGGYLLGRGDSDLEALNFFASEARTDTLNQHQDADNEQFNYSTRFSYTEPIGNGQYLEASHRRQNFERESNKDFFDIVNAQRFRNTNLSNRFINDYTFDRFGVAYQLNRKKSNFTAQLELQESRLNGSLQTEIVPIRRSFTNWLPSARWRYEFTGTKSVGINYATSVREPSIDQLQPIVDNSDPLNVFIGNPGLQPEYQHELQMQTMLYDQFSFTSFFAFLNVRFTQDKIINATAIDAQLRQTIEPVNVDNDLLVFGNMSFGRPLRFMKSRMNINTNFNYNRSLLFINGMENTVNRWNGNLSLTLENRKKEVVDIIVGGEWGYSATQYAVNAELDQAFGDQSYFVDFTWLISDAFSLNTIFDYTMFPKGPFDSAQSLPIWEASVSWYLLKDKRGELRLSAFDLLNRNVGVNRNASFNFIENERIASLGRYFMVSFVYNLKGFGK